MNDRWFAFAFGVIFVSALLYLSVLFPNPTATTFFIFRVVLALAAAGVGAVIPGLLIVHVGKIVRAGGAIALFVLVFLINPPALVAPHDVDTVERAELALSSGDTTSAITLFSEALTYNPKNWRAQSGLARSHYARADYSSAREAFEKAVSISKNIEWAPMVGLSMSQEGTGDIEGAAASLAMAAPLLKPGNPTGDDIRFDEARLLIKKWLRNEAPRITPTYTSAASLLNEFLEHKAYPDHWALYHLACLRATAAQYPLLSVIESTRLRDEAQRLLRDSIARLDKYASPKAQVQREMLRDLLASSSQAHTRPGEPIKCQAIVSLWNELEGKP